MMNVNGSERPCAFRYVYHIMYNPHQVIDNNLCEQYSCMAKWVNLKKKKSFLIHLYLGVNYVLFNKLGFIRNILKVILIRQLGSKIFNVCILRHSNLGTLSIRYWEGAINLQFGMDLFMGVLTGDFNPESHNVILLKAVYFCFLS